MDIFHRVDFRTVGMHQLPVGLRTGHPLHTESKPPIGEFILMIMHQFNQWCNFISVRAFTDIITISVPRDVAHVIKFRQVGMHELRFQNICFI